MGFLDKVMFWKHEDELDFDKVADKELGLSQDELGLEQGSLGLDKESTGLDEKSPFEPKELPPHLQEAITPETNTPLGATETPPGTAPTTTSGKNRDLELISSKLDTIKAILTSLDQRIANLEKAAGVEQKEKLW